MSDMILYSLPHSPYAARVRLMVALKGLEVSVEAPPEGLASETFKALTPTGKVPVLVAEGLNLPESIAIMEYLDECFPDSALLFGSPAERAWQRAASRFVDLGLAPALFPLFAQLRAEPKDEALIAKSLEDLKHQLGVLTDFVRRSPGAMLAAESPAFFDCVLTPVMFYIATIVPIFGEGDVLAGQSELSTWWSAVQENNAVTDVLEEMRAGLAAMMGG